jgi:hypothetical protein
MAGHHTFVANNPGIDVCATCGKTRAARVHRRPGTRTVRGYSTAFKAHGAGRRFSINGIPAGFWSDVTKTARREGISMRALVLQLLTDWRQKHGDRS